MNRGRDSFSFDDSAARDLERFGFVAIQNFCDESDLLSIRAMLMELYARRAGYRDGNFFDMLGVDRDSSPIQPELLRPSFYAPKLRNTSTYLRAFALARHVVNEKVELAFDHSLLKLAGSCATPWHQDVAHRRDPNFDYEQITVWIPLQEATTQNGCLRYIPGSHVGPVVEHRSYNNDPRVHAIECTPGQFNPNNYQAAPIAFGSAMLHRGTVIHGAFPNKTEKDRLSLSITFEIPPVRRQGRTLARWLQEKEALSSAPVNVRKRVLRLLGRTAKEVRMGILFKPCRLRFEILRAVHEIRTLANK